MKHKVSELESALLDAAVAKAHVWRFKISPSISSGDICFATVPDLEHGDGNGLVGFQPSTSWEQGGPIIERERITVVASTGIHCEEPLEWSACVGAFSHYIDEPLPFVSRGSMDGARGPTALVAAMRAYVASKFGEEVELP